MKILGNILVILVAALHSCFLVLEMFLWNGPIGQRVFSMTQEFSSQSAVLAANQGLYNGFLAAGLMWGLAAGRRDVKVFFLMCVIAAGIYGGLTANLAIIYMQSAPALLALVVVFMAKDS